MADVAMDYQGKCDELVKADKEVKEWGVFTHIRQSVDKFRKLMELLRDTLLKKSIRDRHWKENVGRNNNGPKVANFLVV